MNEAKRLITEQARWRIIDQTGLGLNFLALQSFAMDDALCASVGTGIQPATARAWVHHNTVVLGIQDSQLPSLQDGLSYLAQQHFAYIVRNSGGLAVVLDEGVLNLSLILPEKQQKIPINLGYEAMFYCLQQMFRDFPVQIEAREIVGSYCPGTYDLSIQGKKFAGISQRRLKDGVAVQIYLCVTGSGARRATLIKEFYRRAKNGEPTKFSPPEINPEVMASLSELLGVPLTISDCMLRFLQTLKNESSQLFSSGLSGEEVSLYTSYFERVRIRNAKALNE